MFRRLLDEETTKLKEKLHEVEKSLKSKVGEIERLERTISHHRIREEELEKQLDHKEASVKRLVES
jgi:chromosome segregation ATPase